METSKDFEEFFELLNEHKVRYLVVGGYAFAVHAEPRATKDLDIFLSTDTPNTEKVVEVLREFGFTSVSIHPQDLEKPDQIIQLGYPPLRIDLLTSISDVSFKQAWKRKISATYGDQNIFVIGKQDLITNKEASGREQDLLDIKKLKD